VTGTLWVTGAAGFSGKHMVRLLTGLPEKPRLVGLDVAEAGPQGLDAYRRLDLNETEAVVSAAREDRPSWVIHLAAAMPPADEAQMWRVNVGGTVSLLSGLASAGCDGCRVVGVGSAAEYLPLLEGSLAEDSPCGGASLYGRVKWAQTLVTREAGRQLGLAVMVARTFNLIGPGISVSFVPGWLCKQFAQSEPLTEITIGNTKSSRDFVDIRDAVAAYWALAQQGEPGEVYNVCSGRATRIQDLIDLLCELTGHAPKIRVDPARLRGADPPVSYGDYGKLARRTGWRPRLSLRDSLDGMLKAQDGADD